MSWSVQVSRGIRWVSRSAFFLCGFAEGSAVYCVVAQASGLRAEPQLRPLLPVCFLLSEGTCTYSIGWLGRENESILVACFEYSSVNRAYLPTLLHWRYRVGDR